MKHPPERLGALWTPYLGYLGLHMLLSPWLAIQGIRRAKRRKYTAHIGERLLGPRSQGRSDVAVMSVALGETRTAIRAARELQGRGLVAVVCPLEDGSATLCAQETDLPSVSAPFNSPLSAWLFLRKVRPREVWFIEWADQTHLLAVARILGLKTRVVNVYFSEQDAVRAARRGARPWRLQLPHRWGVQGRAQRLRLEGLGVPSDRIAVVGPSIGLTLEDEPTREAWVQKWAKLLLLTAGDPLIVAGSTYPDEERMLVDALKLLRQTVPGARLVLTPRHVDRAVVVEGVPCARRSDGPTTAPVIVLDTLGELRELYAVARVAHIGGTYDPAVGGHTPVEALAAGVAFTHGPEFAQQAAWMELLAGSGLAREAHDAEGLDQAWREILALDPEPLRSAARALAESQSSVFSSEWDR